MSTSRNASPTATYAATVRSCQPQGYAKPYWMAVTTRAGKSRATDICRHQHDAREAAQACAGKLAAMRNSGQSLR